MRYLIRPGIVVVILFTLSACMSPSFDEHRSEICPTCTDAQWKVKTAEFTEKLNELRAEKYIQAQEERQRANSEAISAFAQKYERCYIRNFRKIETLGVTSPEFLALCDEYVADQAKINGNSNVAGNGQPTLQVSGHHPGVGTIPHRKPQISDTPLWSCLDKNNWGSRASGGGKSALSCISAENSKGSTFTVSVEVRSFNPPSDDFDWSNPTTYLKLFTVGCNIKARKKVVATSPPNPAVVALNLGLEACRKLRDSMESKGPGYLGEYEIYLDEALVQSCPTFKPKGFAKIMDHIYCFQLMLANEQNRSKLATYTGVRPYNKFGSPDAVHILHSCANVRNWASYGRDATSEEVALCKTRDTLQTGSPYWVEARQVNLGDGNETIKITIGASKSNSLNKTKNTRIREISLTYLCGNKSFDRMRKEPRETSAACINDMLGLVHANQSRLNSDQRSHAELITALGGYGRTNAEEIHILTCRDSRLGTGCKG